MERNSFAVQIHASPPPPTNKIPRKKVLPLEPVNPLGSQLKESLAAIPETAGLEAIWSASGPELHPSRIAATQP